MAGDCRFPRQSRLLAPAEFRRVFERAQRSSDGLFTILARRHQLDGARLGLAISRKVANRAVDRNRVKRLVRESFRHRKARLRGLDLVVMARSQAVSSDAIQVRASLERHWNRLVTRCARS